MPILNRKSREERDIETQMNIKLLKKKAENYANKCEEMAKKYDQQKSAAREIGNKGLEQVFSEKAANLRLQESKIKSFILIVDDIAMMKDQSSIMNSFAETMKSYIKTIGRGSSDSQWMATMEQQLDRAMNESERVEDFFGGLLQDAGFGLNRELDLIQPDSKQESLEKNPNPSDRVAKEMKDKIKKEDQNQ